MIIGVFGISGVGKSTLCEKLPRIFQNIEVYSASQLIKIFDGEISFNKLSKDNVNSNQLKLISVVNDLKIKSSRVSYVLELHNVIETEVEDIYIPKQVFERLGIDRVIFLYKKPSEIFRQRLLGTKERSLKNIENIDDLQTNSLNYLMEIFPNEITKVLFLSDLSINEATASLCKEIESYFTP